MAGCRCPRSGRLSTSRRPGCDRRFHTSRWKPARSGSCAAHAIPCASCAKIPAWLRRIKRADGDVVTVKIPERKLHRSSAGIYMWLFFQPADESARPWQSYVKIIDPEEQEEAVARRGEMGARQRGMIVGAPLVETKQDRSIRVEDLPKIVVGGSRLRQAK